MSWLRKHWRDPSFLIDLAQVLVATGAAIALALDMVGVWSGVDWLSNNIEAFTFIAVCTLIVSMFLERRIKLDAYFRSADEKLDRIARSQAGGIQLRNRAGFHLPLHERLANARQVYLLGINLSSVLTQYQGLIISKAIEGCKFKVVATDPAFFGRNDIPPSWLASTRKERDLEHSMDIVRYIAERAGNENVELTHVSVPPPYSLLMIDPEEPEGEIQVELYTYQRFSQERPHFILTRGADRAWYDFFRREFDLALQNRGQNGQRASGANVG